VLFLIWLFAMWVTAERHRQPAPVYIWAVWIVVLAPQIYSSARSISYDVGNPYSGSKAVAKYLQSQDLPNRRVSASGYEAMSIQPYFTHNIFSNYHGGQNPAFWLWSTTNSFPQLMSSVPPDRPDLLVVALRTEEQRDAAAHLVRSLPQAGYVVGGWFSGQLYWKNSVLEPESFLVARRRDVAEIRER
jgi:hypothetical protein